MQQRFTAPKGKATPKRKRHTARVAGADEHAKNASATKSGPGRHHAPGHQKASLPKQRGAGPGFVLHHASPEKRARRAAIKAFGGVRALKRRLRYVAEVRAELGAGQA